jgi:two-component system LytT family response regulator
MNDNSKLKALIVDDDLQFRKLLNILLKKFPEINVVGEAASLRAAVDLINSKKPDSIFLDVCLKNESGFDLINKINKDTKIVFVSAYDEYALKAFEIDALDYLKKPLEKDRLALTVKRLLKEKPGNGDDADLKTPKSKGDSQHPEMKNRNGSNKRFSFDDRILISGDGISRFIKISSILCITAEKDYSYIYAVGEKKHIVLKSMVEWEERLPSKYFVRIHRSTIINLEYVERVEKWFNYSYHVYSQGLAQPLTMSRRYAAKLKQRFK